MEISSLAIMCVTIFIFVVTFVLLCCDPDPFDYFRYSFKKKVSTLGCWSIYIAGVVTSVLLLSVLPEMSWTPMIPLGVVMLYVLAFMPYK